MPDPDLIRDVVVEYSEACAEVNSQLLKIGELLNKGLYSDAIQLSEETPNTLDVLAELEFNRLLDWKHIVGLVGFDLPPTLRTDIAEQLEEAYATQMSLEGLLKKHRLLALSRAPLKARIKILQLILKKDSANPIWSTDLQTWEKERLHQISSELKIHVRKKSFSEIDALDQELNGPWVIRVSRDIRDQVTNAQRKFQQETARTELASVNTLILEAFNEFDFVNAALFYQQWQVLANNAQLQPNDRLKTEVQDALAWIEEEIADSEKQQQFQSKLSILERALDRGASQTELDSIHYQVNQFQMNVPDHLSVRLTDYQHTLAVSRRRKFILVSGSIGALLIIVAVLLFQYIDRTNTQNQITSAVTDLVRLRQKDEIESALRLYESLPASIQAASPVTAEKEQLESLRAKEQARALSFEESIQQVESHGYENPLTDILDHAEELAETNSEKRQIADFQSRLKEFRQNALVMRNEDFLSKLETYRAQVLAAEQKVKTYSISPTEVQQLGADILAWQKLHKGFQNGSVIVSLNLLEQVTPLTLRLKSLGTQLKDYDRQQAVVKETTQKIGDLNSFYFSLESLAKQSPSSDEKLKLGRTIREKDGVHAYQEWESFLSLEDFNQITTLLPIRAKQLINQASALSTQNGNVEISVLFDKYQAPLEAISNRIDAFNKATKEDVKVLLHDPLVEDVWLVVDKSDRYYYCPTAPTVIDDEIITFNFLPEANGDPIEKKSYVKDIKYHGISPQSELADRLIKHLQNLDMLGWERCFYLMTQEILDEQALSEGNRTNPILSLLLLRRVVSIGRSGSHAFHQAFEKFDEKIQDSDLEIAVDWVNPENNEAIAIANKVRMVLNDLKSNQLDDSGNHAAELLKNYSQPLEVDKLDWIGWLWKDKTGTDQILLKSVPSKDSKLFVLAPTATGSALAPREIGKVNSGTPVILDHTLFQHGRPVFVIAN